MTPEEKAELRERKRRRIDLLNRRSIAWLIEIALLELTVTPILVVMTVNANTASRLEGVPIGLSLIAWGLYSLARDTIGDASIGKRMMKLSLQQQESPESPSTSAKIQRNIPLVIPLGPVVEFVVLYFGGETQIRLGDRLASTRVVDAAPDANKTGTHSGLLLLSWFGLSIVHALIVPALVRFYLSP